MQARMSLCRSLSMIILYAFGAHAFRVPEYLEPSSFQDDDNILQSSSSSQLSKRNPGRDTSQVSLTMNVHISPPPPPQCVNSTSTQGRYTSLICWLWELELIIPDQEFSKGIISVKIHDMICSQFQVNSTNSEYIPGSSNRHTDPLLDLTIHGVSATCSGQYKTGLTGGTVQVLVDNIANKPIHIQTAINSSIIQPKDSDIVKIPVGANITDCETNLQVPKEGGISFTGSFSSKFVELFSKPIARHVTSTLNSQICPQVEQIVNEKLTAFIVEMDAFLEKLIFGKKNGEGETLLSDNSSTSIIDAVRDFDFEKKTSNPLHIFNLHGENTVKRGESDSKDSDGTTMQKLGVRELESVQNPMSTVEESTTQMESMQIPLTLNATNLLEWNEVILLQKSINAASSLINTHLDEGILLDLLERVGWFGRDNGSGSDCIDCGYFFRGVNGLIRNITDNGQLHLKIHRDVDFVIKKLGRISLTVQNITIGGLDTFTRLGLYPEEPHYLTPKVGLNELEFRIGVDMKVFPGDDTYISGDPLEESFNVFVNASSLLLDFKADIGILKDELHTITLEDLFNGQYSELVLSLAHLALSNSTSKLSVDAIGLHPSKSSDSLEISLDELVNNVINLVLSEYHELVSRSLEASFNGPGLDSINKALRRWIQGEIFKSHSFEESKTGSTGMQDFYQFNESQTVRAIHDYFSSQIFTSKTNAFAACISSFIQENPLIPKSTLHKGMSIFMEYFSFENLHIDNQGKNERWSDSSTLIPFH